MDEVHRRGDPSTQRPKTNAPLNIHFTQNRHNWDTIIVCHLLKSLFGKPLSSADLNRVIKARTGLTETSSAPAVAKIEQSLCPQDIETMLIYAKDPIIQDLYPATCRYAKWERVTARLWAMGGKKDLRDEEELSAWIIYHEALMTADLLVGPSKMSLLDRVRVATGMIERPAAEPWC